MGINFDTSDLEKMADRFDSEFTNGLGKVGFERSLVRGENVVKGSITKLQLVRTGNMRNSTTHTQPKVTGSKITGEIITGSPLGGLSTVDAKTGKTIKPAQPENYASHVEERFMYMRRVLGRIENINQTEMQTFLDAWANRESAR